MNKIKNYTKYELFIKIVLMVFICYFSLAGLFYYLGGEQLHFRQSKGNIQLQQANTGAIEVAKGNVITQEFVSQIQLLQGISVQMGTYMRENEGLVNIQLMDTNTNEILVEKSIYAGEIKEGEIIDLPLSSELEGTYGHVLKVLIYSNDSVSGKAVSPLINTIQKLEHSQLYFNNNAVDGTLCFTAYGRDRVWTGIYYKEIVFCGFIVLLIISLVILVEIKSGRKSYILNLFYAIKKYKFLIQQLVSRDFKTKYKRSVLGAFWSFLNPLLMMGVQYFIFSTIFKTDIKYYNIYLLIGVVIFNYFSESCGMALTSIVCNAGLITKVYIPKYIYPLSKVLSSTINLLISFIPLIGMIIFTQLPFSKSYFLIPFVIVCLIVFCLGLGMLLSSSMVYFRDTQFLWGVVSMIWMYATPIFYPESIIPVEFKFVLDYNPICYFIKFARICILEGISPEPILYVQCFLFAFVMLIIGAITFKKTQDNFILNL